MPINSDAHMEFQSEVARVFQKYEENKEGFYFPAMVDNILGWIIFNLQHRYPKVTKETFIDAFSRTWDEIAARPRG